jgi:hypothetical protein
MRRKLTTLTWLPIFFLLAVVLACGEEAGSDRIEISLQELNGSGQSGMATLTASGGSTEVVLSLGGGNMTSKPVHIHNGQCGPALAGVAHGLTDFTDGKSVTMLDGVTLESLMTGTFAINAHNAEDPSVYTACGNIPVG